MLGLSLYAFLSFGMGSLLPPVMLETRRSIGAQLLAGYAVMLAGCFILIVLLQLRLPVALAVLAGVAAIGLIRTTIRSSGNWRTLATHPAAVLLLLGAAGIAANGGIDYLPYAVDEFTNWIGVSREIHLNGSYEAVRRSVYLPGYTPGWRLVLLLPWQIGGEVATGQSAAAPFVLHVGLLALIFDILRCEVGRRLPADGPSAALLAWAALLLYLAAEGTGALWTRVLLIEQPQIYFLAAIAVLFFALDAETRNRRAILVHIGIACAGAYLLKSAALALVPGLVLAALLVSYRGVARDRVAPMRTAALAAAILLLPMAITAILWRAVTPDTASGCLASPLATLTPDALAKAMTYDWLDLLRRFSGAVWSYVAGYKAPVLLAAVAGTAVAVSARRTTVFLVLGAFTLIYLGLLYWYHLSCFGDYYFATLNSIPRFTRVALQPFHAVGLVALAAGILRFMSPDRAEKAVRGRAATILFAAVALILAGWQAVQIERSLADMTTRVYQHIDPRLAEVRRAGKFIEATYAQDRPPPFLQFVSQGTDADIVGYAKMYELGGTQGHPRLLFRYSTAVSWSPEAPTNVWQSETDSGTLRAKLAKADVIWPIITDPWIAGILRSLAAPGTACPEPIVAAVLVKRADGAFDCRLKP